MNAVYYHNPRCSKSRMGLEALNQKNISLTVKEYLKEELTVAELLALFLALKKPAIDVIRKKESLYKELSLENKDLTEKEWAEIIVKNPVLLERPILLKGDNARIGRPTEDLFDII